MGGREGGEKGKGEGGKKGKSERASFSSLPSFLFLLLPLLLFSLAPGLDLDKLFFLLLITETRASQSMGENQTYKFYLKMIFEFYLYLPCRMDQIQ